MRKILSVIFVLLLASPFLMAQKRTGDIYGKVFDEDGNPLPGVTLTLNGKYITEMSTVTSAKGLYRFVSLHPAEDYTITAKLQGFKTETRQNIIVTANTRKEINITLEMGEIEEEVTVIAETPIVEPKSTKVAHNVTHEMLQSLPSARDPWVIAQMAPGVLLDRENVGGSESGQQSDMLARGMADDDQTTYNIDGMNITDPDAIGASPSYYDFDSFEEINYTIGGSEVTTQQSGINLNIVTRRGGNKVSVGGRLFWTEEGFQMENEEFVEEKKKEEVGFKGINKITDIKDYGFNVGAPIIKDKLWAWGSFGVQDINTVTVLGTKNNTMLQNMALKVNAQVVPENRLEFFAHMGKKNKWGRSSEWALPAGLFQGEPRHFGNPIIKLQDEHMFGDDLFVSLKYVWSETGFTLVPMENRDGENPAFYDETLERWIGPDGRVGEYRNYYMRPTQSIALRTNYYNDDLLGASHEVLFGFEYSRREAETKNRRPGHMDVTWRYDWGSIADFDEDGDFDPAPDPYFMWWDIDRYTVELGIVDAPSFYLRDTVTFGNFNVLVGFRYDIQQPILGKTTSVAVNDHSMWNPEGDNAICTAEVKDFLVNFMPPMEVDKTTVEDFDGNIYNWQDFCPRIGLTWDVMGNGKTIAKLSFNQYSSQMDVDWGENWYPAGLGGDVQFWWWDDGDMVAEMQELYWYWVEAGPEGTLYNVFDENGNFVGDVEDAAGEFYSGWDPNQPTTLLPYRYNNYDSKAGSLRTTEIMATLQREIIPDLGATVNATYRRYYNFNYDHEFYLDENDQPWLFESPDWYISRPIPDTVADTGGSDWDGDTGGADEYYYRDPEYETQKGKFNVDTYTPFELTKPRPGYYREYYGVDFIVNKRLSNRWMLNASFTLQTQKRHWDEKAMFDKSNIWALNDEVYAPYSGGGSGKSDAYIFSPWMLKISGLYQLPYGFNVSFFFNARRGWLIRERFRFRDYRKTEDFPELNPRNPRDYRQWMYIEPFGEEHLPNFYKLDLRLEKVVNVSDIGNVYLVVDLFNALNNKHVNRRAQKDWGQYYYRGPDDPDNHFETEPDAYRLSEVLNPFVARFGFRFEF